ncbi:unnamed protein product [Aspergillus oryzae]|uniref:Unnamed protein product n=2 Tax=Aspergillus oryzae TaxID=5062 RepID=A0AAN4Z1Y7_ASPOZ|nr:unnamed protein product [Aspergillus oryzae]GMF97429.1 unnamed protein product [Aspergillus oryzae]GMG39118.1 unnamed protein product [Aspergillus oryzae]GMG50027.1 unnamed protein product [Aspergillus oryzae var. brunneus]
MTLQAIKYSGGKLAIIDQLQLPHVEKYVTIHTSEEGWHAIKEMRVRGAPAIAIVAALALASELTTLIARNQLSSNAIETQTFITEKLHYLVSSRPTAVNLSDAAGKLETIVAESVKMPESTGHAVATAFIQAAEAMLAKDVEDNRMIGEYGAKWISENALSKNFTKATVLTHYSMAAALLARAEIGVDAIVVGADRVAANGDTANKIGTYGLAVLAKYHGVKFLVAAPLTTIDLVTKSGNEITIEERPASEVTTVRGTCEDGGASEAVKMETVCIAAKGINVWNPAFDITPGALIDGIITEKGVVEKDSDGLFHLEELFKA